MDLFAHWGNRHRRGTILPRYLAEEAEKFIHRGDRQDRAFEIIKKWADMGAQGHLARKETALDASFLFEVFGEAVSVTSQSLKALKSISWSGTLRVPGVGTADGGARGVYAWNPAVSEGSDRTQGSRHQPGHGQV